MKKYKRYNKKSEYSYTLGAFPTIELLQSDKEIEAVFIDENYKDKEKLIDILNEKKNKTLVIAAFKKESQPVLKNKNHIFLHEISDMGNLGTIMRSMLAFSVKDLVLVGNVADYFNPKVIRASMGAFFKLRISHYENMEEYLRDHKNNLYLFMLSLDEKDSIYRKKVEEPFALVMGNEASGLPNGFEKYGEKVFIPQSKDVDSLNLPIATSIGLYEFRRKI